MTGMRTESFLPAWLACLLCLYPAYWLVSFLLFAAPALGRVAFSGHTLTNLSIGFPGVNAASRPPVASPARRGNGGPSVPAGLGTALLLGLVVRRHRVIAGVSLAMLGAVGTPQLVMRMAFMKQATTADILAVCLFFAILCAGMRLLLIGLAPQGFWRRVGALYAAFVIPVSIVLVSASLLLFRRRLPGFYFPVALAPAALSAMLVSLWPVRHSDGFVPLTWRPVAALIAAALVIAAAGWTGARTFAYARQETASAALAAIPPIPTDLPFPKMFFQKGVNFTAEFPGYSSENARLMLRALPKHGINSIALVPYGFVDRTNGHVRFGGGMESDAGIEQLSRLAHQLNIKVLLKPQTMSQAGYPGDLDFASLEIRNVWFKQYTKFVEHYAELAKRIHADMFCVGVEFQKLVQYEGEWRKIIARARGIYPGPLVYAATQGPEFETIQFWDDLDYIGLDNYYPLPDDLSTTEVVHKVETVQKKFQKPVIFTEAGFASFEGSHREPWSEKPGKIALADQARCYEAVLRAFYHKPWFQGIYWWKVGTDGHGGLEDASLTPWGKPAMDVVARWYLEQGR